jgi:hypothetical protein
MNNVKLEKVDSPEQKPLRIDRDEVCPAIMEAHCDLPFNPSSPIFALKFAQPA